MLVPCDAHAEMAEAALRLLNDPDAAKRLAGQGRNECLKYQWQTVRDAWIRAYFDLKNEHGIGSVSEPENISQPSPERRAVTK